MGSLTIIEKLEAILLLALDKENLEDELGDLVSKFSQSGFATFLWK